MINKVTLKCACGAQQSSETDSTYKDYNELVRPLRIAGWIKLTDFQTSDKRWNCPDCYEDFRTNLQSACEDK